MCGADTSKTITNNVLEGSPPRVRSRPRSNRPESARTGITSACAEQTCQPAGLAEAAGDHLRVCGADARPLRSLRPLTGSPPRVRSRRRSGHQGRLPGRITSACAEQTSTAPMAAAWTGDHLRVCGADVSDDFQVTVESGSPPRVRSRHTSSIPDDGRVGITSACAEQTCLSVCCFRTRPDHLRVCGADSCILLCSEPAEWRGIFDLRTA